MKVLSVCALLLFASFAYAAVSLDDIVKLSKANTKDDVILQLIQKEGLSKSVTSKDIVYLKQQGVSDRVIQYLIKLSAEEQSAFADKNMRSYYKTTKNGKQIRVMTNLDENGKRMGGEIPPDPEPAQQQAPVYEHPPQEIRVVVENDSRRDDRYEEDYPEYVDDRYTMPGFPSYYPYSTPYYPYYPYNPGHHHGQGYRPTKDPNQPDWNYDYSKNRPLVRPRQQPSSPTKIPGSKPQGVRAFKGR